jgi:threonine synthase
LLASLPERTDPSEIEIQYVVPTGNFGDVLAGYYAKRMGLPNAKLAIATNANDILTRFWKTGRYEKVDSSMASALKGNQDASGVRETLSPAMDILVSSNFERLLWYLASENSSSSDETSRRREACETVARWMNDVKKNGRMEVPPAVLETARRDFVAERVDDHQVGFFYWITELT